MSRADRDRWNRTYTERGETIGEPSAFLRSLDAVLPRAGRALDVAGGSGRHAIWLARRGLSVTLADISDVGPGHARQGAERAGVSVAVEQVDLEVESLPAGPWNLIVDFHFLVRDLFASYARELAAGGMLVFCHPTRRNLERHARPSERFLLEEGEVLRLVTGLEIVSYDEGWQPSGRHEARLVAVRPGE